MSKHTPTPWEIKAFGAPPQIVIGPCDPKPGAPSFTANTLGGNDAANAAHIIHCVNTYDALVEALEKVVAWGMPSTDRTWDDGTPMSYSAVHGSNGERDHIRRVAMAALSQANRKNP